MARRRNNARRTDEFGAPGSHAGHIARTNILYSVGCTGGALLAAAATAWALLAANLIGTAVAAAVCVLFAFAARGYWRTAERGLVGARSERRAAAAIVSAGPHVVIHGALISGRGDLDHAVIGPGLVAVETKTGYGKVRIVDGHLVAGRRQLKGNPINQVKTQAAALRRVAGHYVEAVVCVVDMENRPFVHDGVTICSAADLPAVIQATRPVLTEDVSYALAARITATPTAKTP